MTCLSTRYIDDRVTAFNLGYAAGAWIGGLVVVIRHTQAGDRSRGEPAEAEFFGISLCATECGVVACSINSC